MNTPSNAKTTFKDILISFEYMKFSPKHFFEKFPEIKHMDEELTIIQLYKELGFSLMFTTILAEAPFIPCIKHDLDRLFCQFLRKNPPNSEKILHGIPGETSTYSYENMISYIENTRVRSRQENLKISQYHPHNTLLRDFLHISEQGIWKDRMKNKNSWQTIELLSSLAEAPLYCRGFINDMFIKHRNPISNNRLEGSATFKHPELEKAFLSTFNILPS